MFVKLLFEKTHKVISVWCTVGTPSNSQSLLVRVSFVFFSLSCVLKKMGPLATTRGQVVSTSLTRHLLVWTICVWRNLLKL